VSLEVGGFVTTFRRGPILEATLSCLFEQTEPPRRILVIDNAGDEETRRIVDGLGESRLEYVGLARNEGPAGAAAHAMRRLVDERFEWIYWGDDDDPPLVRDALERLGRLAGRHEGADLGAVASSGIRWNWRTGEADRLPNEALVGDLAMDAAGGNQQLLLHRRVPERIGAPNASLFFGLEEIEYCLRMRRAGLRLMVDGALALECRELSGHLARVPRRDPLRRHPETSLWRRYYATRNYVHLMARTFGRRDLALRETAKAVLRATAAWRYGLSYGAAMSRFQWRGVLDGWRGNLGLTVAPRAFDGRYFSKRDLFPWRPTDAGSADAELRGQRGLSVGAASTPAATGPRERRLRTQHSLGAFVVTFRRPVALRSSIESLLAQTRPPDLVLVVDNGGSAEAKEICRSFGDKVLYEATGANLGSAGGTAYGTRRLYELGFDLVCSGDDDNPPSTADTLERLVRLIEKGGSGVAGAGAVGTRWDWRRGRIVRLPNEILKAGPIDVDFIGGDQLLTLRRQVIEQGGAPNARLFFGYPDLEHCLRIRQAGWRLLIDGELMLAYRARFGRLEHSGRRSLVPRRPESATWRYYYTTRNYIEMMARTFGRSDLALRETGRALARCAGSWSRGPRYGGLVTGYVFRGIVDGWRGRQGPAVRPREKAPTESQNGAEKAQAAALSGNGGAAV
jgi:GT2 family glycosyltransferase